MFIQVKVASTVLKINKNTFMNDFNRLYRVIVILLVLDIFVQLSCRIQ